MKLALALLVLLAPSAAAQSTWYVDDDGTPPGNGTEEDPFTSIQHAIDQGTTLDGHTLLVLPGQYGETVDFAGKSLAVASTDGAEATTVDGSGAGSVVTVTSGVTVVLEGLTLTGGSHTPAGGGLVGGGIYCSGSTLTVRECVVTENGSGASRGGGVYAEDSTVDLVATTVSCHTVADGGGAGLALVDCTTHGVGLTVSENQSEVGPGGGILVDGGSLGLVDSTVALNMVFEDSGGGLALSGADVRIVDSEIVDNSAVFLGITTAVAGGGGIQAVDGGSLRLERVLVARNVTELLSGAGLAVGDDVVASASRCVFHSNQASGFPGPGGPVGGASRGPVAMDHCTLFGNGADGGGGGAFGGDLRSSIVWGNAPEDLAGPTRADFSDVGGGWPGTRNLDADPLFVDPGALDLALAPGSPCVDAGAPDDPADTDGTPADMGAHAFEWPEIGERYCRANPNSSGLAASMLVRGSSSVADDFLRLDAVGVARNKFGFFLASADRDFLPFFGGSKGNLCLGTPVQRVLRSGQDVVFSGPEGRGGLRLDLDSFGPKLGIEAGVRRHFQFWFRDVVEGESTSNTSDGVTVRFR